MKKYFWLFAFTLFFGIAAFVYAIFFDWRIRNFALDDYGVVIFALLSLPLAAFFLVLGLRNLAVDEPVKSKKSKWIMMGVSCLAMVIFGCVLPFYYKINLGRYDTLLPIFFIGDLCVVGLALPCCFGVRNYSVFTIVKAILCAAYLSLYKEVTVAPWAFCHYNIFTSEWNHPTGWSIASFAIWLFVFTVIGYLAFYFFGNVLFQETKPEKQGLEDH